VANNQNIITLTSTQSFYTHNKADAFRVIKGVALVYIVPWLDSEKRAGRKILIGEFRENQVFPALSYRDAEYTSWRFAIVSKESDLQFEILPSSVTSVLCKRFLDKVGVQHNAQEGYEACLVDTYNREILKDEVFIQRGIKNKPQLGQVSAGVIKQALHGEEVAAEIGRNELYGILAYVCKKKKMTIAPPERIAAACGKEITVPAIARLSNFTCRAVVLDDQWYKNDCGIIVAQMDEHPVVCIPDKHQGYTIYNHDHKAIKLTKSVAGRIEPSAYALGRCLPKRDINTKELISFSLNGIPQSDVVYVLILGLLGAIIGILLPTLNQKIYDEYIPLGEYGILIQMCVLIGTFMVANGFFALVKKLFEFRISCRVGYDIQNALYHRIFQLPESFFRNYDSADLAQRLSGAEGIANQLATAIVATGFSSIFSLIYLFRMISYSGKLTIISFAMVVLYGLVIVVLDSRTLKYESKITKAEGDAAAKLYQYLTGIEKIRMAGEEERFVLEHTKPMADKQYNMIKQNRITAASSILIEISTYVFSMVLYVFVVNKNVEISTGAFIAFNSAFGSLAASMLELINSGIGIWRLKPGYLRLMPILQTKVEDEEGKELVGELTGSLRLEHICFSYNKDEKTVLNDFSMEVKPGEYVAIVGPSGCGKSTMLKIMLGFETPDAGSVYYDDKDLSSLDKHSLRRKLGVVLQNGKLISGSIYDNITITAPKATIKEVNEVIEAVGLKDDIDMMPMGIQTVLSESGGTISGGQQQRILIARSIMNHPAILFFDEATSALDNLTQAKVCEHLDSMNVTRIVIAHRLSTIKNCDRIIVLNKGRVVEEGDYASLMQHKGLFYQMAYRQLTE
jgi:ATP-binding cassette subfamily C protein